MAKIALNRPPMNILNLEAMREIVEAVSDASGREDVSIIIISSSGDRAFSAGADVEEHMPGKAPELIESFHKLVTKVLYCEKPTVAVVKGYALGGGLELALACDFVLASSSAKLGQPEIKVGVYPPAAVALMPRLIGFRNAVRLILTGDSVTAEEAVKMGLVTMAVPSEELEASVNMLAATLLEKSPLVLKLAKKAILDVIDKPVEQGLQIANDIYLNSLMKSEDAVEGLRAFLEKRKPVWRGI